MLFMLVSRPRPGSTREDIVAALTQRLQPGTWDLIRKGRLSNVLYKVGDDPGFFALLQAESLDQAQATVAAARRPDLPLEVEVVPVNLFPHFD
jgi:hypothetical protein